MIGKDFAPNAMQNLMAIEAKRKIQNIKIINIYQKIIAVSEDLRIPKEGNNNYKGFKYFKPDDIAREIVPLLKKHELILFFNMPFNKDKGMYEGKLIIEESGDSSAKVELQFDIPLTSVQGATEAQNAGATLTYCKRYMIMNAFNLADNEADPDHTMGAPEKKTTASAKPTGAPVTGGKPSSKFDEMMGKLQRVKKAQLDIFLAKVLESTQYSDEQKNEFKATVMQLKQKK